MAAVGNQDAGDTRIARRAPRAAETKPETVLAAVAAMNGPAATAMAAAAPYFTTSRREGSESPPPKPSLNVFMAASPLPVVASARPFCGIVDPADCNMTLWEPLCATAHRRKN
jgi:hypothetical protein